MTRRAWRSGCIGALLLWLVIGLIFAAGLAVGRATASVPWAWSPASSAGLHLIPAAASQVANESDAVQRGAPDTDRPTGARPPMSEATGSAEVRPEGSGAPSHPAVVSENPRPPVLPTANPRLTDVTLAVGKGQIGWATWYATSGPGEYAAAGPALRTAGWRGSNVVVCAFPSGQATCITIPLTDWCACGDRNGSPTLLDLSADAFRQLGALSQGVLRVTVQEVR